EREDRFTAFIDGCRSSARAGRRSREDGATQADPASHGVPGAVAVKTDELDDGDRDSRSRTDTCQSGRGEYIQPMQHGVLALVSGVRRGDAGKSKGHGGEQQASREEPRTSLHGPVLPLVDINAWRLTGECPTRTRVEIRPVIRGGGMCTAGATNGSSEI